MIIEEEVYLEHYGVQGMKWGQRRAANKANVARLQKKGLTKRQAKVTTRVQNKVDAQKMAAVGRQGKVTALRQLNNRMISNSMLSAGTIVRHPLSTRNAANRQLEVNTRIQRDIANGERTARSLLLRLQGISIENLDFST